jgi:wyosine [tRNA(Phe)-imidazoG37] synthetase (radical SAM superfamily)
MIRSLTPPAAADEDALAAGFTTGPVRSRRLGRSLGVDCVPFKTCNYDCIYCELGKTDRKTMEIREYFPLAEIVREIDFFLRSAAARPDHVTISGCGEPTLYSRLGELISAIKDMTDIPVALITNGSLFSLPQVLRAVSRADVILPSLDAAREKTFQEVNRPHPLVSLADVKQGLFELRQKYTGRVWLEIFVTGMLSASEGEWSELKCLADGIRPDKIHLNNLDRGAAEPGLKPVGRRQMELLAAVLGPDCEII